MTDTGNFQVNQLVWAKMKGFSPWPARVVEPIAELKRQPKKSVPCQCIFFFGTLNYAWIEESNLKPYEEFKAQLIKSGKSAAFREACEQIEEYKADPAKFNAKFESVLQPPEPPKVTDEDFDKLRENNSFEYSTEEPAVITPPPPPKAAKKKANKSSEKATAKSVRPILKAKSNYSEPPPKRRRRSTDNNVSEVSDGLFLNDDFVSPRRNPASRLLNRPAIPQGRPDTPELDIESVSKTLQKKNIIPSSKTFGFLGLGIIGRGIVKNLLNSGHKVIVWNRNFAKCRKFEMAGAETRLTPCDVIESADITFCCVSDPKAIKEVVFGNCGVLHSTTFENKGYVEMTTIDEDISRDIAEAITSKNGTYLEAQIQGSKFEAEEGTLVILAAGDRGLFTQCQSCFEAMGKNSFFLGDIGNAAKMNLVLQILSGITVAGLGEALALADRAGLKMKDVMEVLELTNVSSKLLQDKGSCIIRNDFATHHPLQHLQKDLRLAIGMADTLEQPLPLTSACNEIFKTAKRQGYGDHDSSAVHITARL